MFQMMISSAIRERLTPIIAVMKANSATKSREAVPSIELPTLPCSKPRSVATASGSRPSDEPASAPEPYGETAVRSSHCRSRSASRDSGWTWARTWWANSTGWACWRWVRPGIATSGWASARPISASWRSAIRPPMIRAWSRRYMRKSVATWSFRDRPARSLPPRSGPRSSNRPRSRAVWTSSSAIVPDEGAVGDVRFELVEAGQHARQLVLGEQARLVQHARVGTRSGDVVRREPPVEVDGRGQLGQGLGGTVGETAAPEPYVTAVAAHLRCSSKAGKAGGWMCHRLPARTGRGGGRQTVSVTPGRAWPRSSTTGRRCR